MTADLSILTETWLTDGQTLDEDLDDLREGAGLDVMVNNRDPGARGVSHGGVAIAYRMATCSFKRIELDNPDRFEVIAALGTLPGHTRKVLVLGCYIPPGYNASRGNGCLDFIENLIIGFKRKYTNPYIVVAGDFNQWKINDVMVNFPDITEADVGPTRGDRSIDRSCLFPRLIRSQSTRKTRPPKHNSVAWTIFETAVLNTVQFVGVRISVATICLSSR